MGNGRSPGFVDIPSLCFCDHDELLLAVLLPQARCPPVDVLIVAKNTYVSIRVFLQRDDEKHTSGLIFARFCAIVPEQVEDEVPELK